MSALETILWIIYGTITMGAFFAWYGRADDGQNEFGFCVLIGVLGAILWPIFFSVFIYQAIEEFLMGLRSL